jgi:hypothetical protein
MVTAKRCSFSAAAVSAAAAAAIAGVPASSSFESYGLIYVHIVKKNDEEMIVQNDSMGGHINIITGKYAKFFLYRRHFLAIVTCNLVLSWGLFGLAGG